MLETRAHVRINGVDYLIAESEDRHYVHTFEPLQASSFVEQPIGGLPGKTDIRRDLMYWDSSDWSGGEGEKFFDPNDPSMYYYSSEANTRNAGYVTMQPPLTVVTVA